MLAICSSDSIIEGKATTYPMTQHVFGSALAIVVHAIAPARLQLSCRDNVATKIMLD